MAPNTRPLECDKLVNVCADLPRKDIRLLTQNERRRQMAHDLNINIHSYDFLLESAEGRIKELKIPPEMRRIALKDD